MHYTSQTQIFKLGRRSIRLQSLLYAALLLGCIALIVPWPSMPVGLLVVALFSGLFMVITAWLVIQQNKLQLRLRHAESQLRQIHQQKHHQPLEAQSLLHVEPENFFNKDQTRH